MAGQWEKRDRARTWDSGRIGFNLPFLNHKYHWSVLPRRKNRDDTDAEPLLGVSFYQIIAGLYKRVKIKFGKIRNVQKTPSLKGRAPPGSAAQINRAGIKAALLAPLVMKQAALYAGNHSPLLKQTATPVQDVNPVDIVDPENITVPLYMGESMMGELYIEVSSVGVFLLLGVNIRGPLGYLQSNGESTNLPPVNVYVNSDVVATDDNIDMSSLGKQWTIPLKETDENSDFEHQFSLSDKINRFYNKVTLVYDDNGTQEEEEIYTPDESAETLLNNIAPYEAGSIIMTSDDDKEKFKLNYESDDFLDQKLRMSHYNQHWETVNEKVLEILNGQNGKYLQQIIWNVYDWLGDTKTLSIENDEDTVELTLPGSVVDNLKAMDERFGLKNYLKGGIERIIFTSVPGDKVKTLKHILSSSQYRIHIN